MSTVDESSPSPVAMALASFAPTKRIVQRNHPVVIAFVLMAELDVVYATAVARAMELRSEPHRDYALALSKANLTARTVALGLVDGDLTDERFHDLVPAVDRARDAALGLVGDRDLDRSLDLVRALDRSDSVGRPARQFNPDAIRRLTDDLGSDLGSDLIDALGRDRDPNLAQVLFRALGTFEVRTSDRSNERAISEQLASAIGRLQARNSALDRARNDFTGADLRGQDVTHLDLEGVRWSEITTLWPPEAEEDIRRISVEIEAGLFEIRRGSTHLPLSVHL